MRHKRNIPQQDYLANLMLWTADPEQVAIVTAAAKQGITNAQYALGLMYAEGRGVTPSATEAYYWLSLAWEQGDKDALLLRQIVEADLTLDEIAATEMRLPKGTLQ